MGPEMVPVALFAFLAVSAIACTPILRAVARRMEPPSSRDERGSSELRERMERMEQAIDAIAVQVERIAEGQRFTTKLLSEQAQEPRHLTSSQHGSEV